MQSLCLIYSHSTFRPRNERELSELILKDRLMGFKRSHAWPGKDRALLKLYRSKRIEFSSSRNSPGEVLPTKHGGEHL